MTIRHRKRPPQHDENQAGPVVNEPALQIECDSCLCDLTHSVRIRCADPVCDASAIDICPDCFCKGKEFGRHKRGHPYRVVEKHSYPIFTDDWGADEELLLLEGLALSGMGNWAAAAEHIGTRTKQEVEAHYNAVYVDSPAWPLPDMNLEFDIKPEVFQQRKRRRIEELTRNPPPPHPAVQNSAPTNHEIAGYMPGRLEFEHEIDNDAEDMIKDLEFGLVLQWGGEEQVEDPEDVKTRSEAYSARAAAMEKASKLDKDRHLLNGFHHDEPGDHPKEKDDDKDKVEIPPLPDPLETPESIELKLSLLEAYQERIERRLEGKVFVLERGLLDYKKMQAADKKRPKEEKEFLQKYKPFAKLQTAEDHELFTEGLLYEHALRKRIAELQEYRRMGLTTFAAAELYEKARIARLSGHRTSSRDNVARPAIRNGHNDLKRSFSQVDADDKKARAGRKAAGPLNLATAPSLHLLTPAEQMLCSQLRILPKPYLAVKESIIREFLKRRGKLTKKEAKDLVRCDVNKTSRVWDFLMAAGVLKVPDGFEDSPVLNGSGVAIIDTPMPMTNGIMTSTPGALQSHPSSPEKSTVVRMHEVPTPPP